MTLTLKVNNQFYQAQTLVSDPKESNLICSQSAMIDLIGKHYSTHDFKIKDCDPIQVRSEVKTRSEIRAYGGIFRTHLQLDDILNKAKSEDMSGLEIALTLKIVTLESEMTSERRNEKMLRNLIQDLMSHKLWSGAFSITGHQK